VTVEFARLGVIRLRSIMAGRSDVGTLGGDQAGDHSEGPLSFAISELYANERPSLRVLFIMIFAEFAAFSMLLPVLLYLFIEDMGLGPEEVGYIGAATSLAELIGAWASGRLSDAIGRRYVLIALFAWAATGTVASAFVFTFFETLVVRMVQGLSGGTVALCDAYVLDVVPSHAAPSYTGFSGALRGIALLIGPSITTMLLRMGVSRRIIFLISAVVSYIAAGFGLAFLKESLTQGKRRPLCGNRQPSGHHNRAAVSFLSGTSTWLLLIGFTRFITVAGFAFFNNYVFLIRDNFDWHDAEFGAVVLVMGVSSALLQLFVFPRVARILGAGVCMCSSLALGSAAMALLPHKNPLVHLCAVGLFIVSGSLSEPSIPVLLGSFAGERDIGFANGFVGSCRALALVLSPPVAGNLYSYGPSFAYRVGAAFVVVGTLTASVIPVLERRSGRPAAGDGAAPALAPPSGT